MGESTERAKEIAARPVNKERARSGESKTASRFSAREPSPAQRGGQRSGRSAEGQTCHQLHEEARRRDIHGRSEMNEEQLRQALGKG